MRMIPSFSDEPRTPCEAWILCGEVASVIMFLAGKIGTKMSEKNGQPAHPDDAKRSDPFWSNCGCVLCVITLIVCLTAVAITWLIVRGTP